MITVGFLICVATGYFIQPAAKRAALRMSKSYRQRQSRRRHARKAAQREYSSGYDELVRKAKHDMARVIMSRNEIEAIIRAQSKW